MPKPTLFIGSSSEAMEIAEKVHQLVEDIAEVKIWNQDTFFPGEHPLESLRREILTTDFALLIITPDDEIIKRGNIGYTARDNILFELGMFMGVLGPRRGFYLVVTDKRSDPTKEVIIPSDLVGITRLQVTLEKDRELGLSIRRTVTDLKDAIRRGLDNIEISLLPSTSLAIGYFNNFVLEVCRTLITLTEFKVGEVTADLTRDNFDFYIVLPNNAFDASAAGALRFARGRQLTQISINGRTGSRNFPFYVDSVIADGRVSLFDFPTTLRAAHEAIRFAMPPSTTQREIELLEQREIANFERTLRRLLRDPNYADFRDNIKLIYKSDLANLR